MKNSTLEDESERKNNKYETPRPVGEKIRDFETQKSPENETLRPIKNASDFNIGPKFSETHVFGLHGCPDLYCDLHNTINQVHTVLPSLTVKRKVYADFKQIF